MRLLLVIGILFLTSAGSAMPTAVQTPARPSPESIDRFTYKGFVLNVARVKSLPNREAFLGALRTQLDMVADAGLDKSTLQFFREIPIAIDLVATADPTYSGANARYAKKLPKERGVDEPGSMTIVARVYSPDAPIILHEFLHAYHDQKLPEGYDNPEILRLFVEARRGHLFPDDSYMLSHVREYFAMAGSVYLHGSASRDPFTREKLKTQQPAVYEWFVRQFGRR